MMMMESIDDLKGDSGIADSDSNNDLSDIASLLDDLPMLESNDVQYEDFEELVLLNESESTAMVPFVPTFNNQSELINYTPDSDAKQLEQGTLSKGFLMNWINPYRKLMREVPKKPKIIPFRGFFTKPNVDLSISEVPLAMLDPHWIHECTIKYQLQRKQKKSNYKKTNKPRKTSICSVKKSSIIRKNKSLSSSVSKQSSTNGDKKLEHSKEDKFNSESFKSNKIAKKLAIKFKIKECRVRLVKLPTTSITQQSVTASTEKTVVGVSKWKLNSKINHRTTRSIKVKE